MRLNYSIVFVADMARSVQFYRDVLGLPLKFGRPTGPSSPPRGRRWLSTSVNARE